MRVRGCKLILTEKEYQVTEQTRPGKLTSGARIGIVNPSYWLESDRMRRAVGVFEDLGYEVILGRSTTLRENQCAGSAEERVHF